MRAGGRILRVLAAGTLLSLLLFPSTLATQEPYPPPPPGLTLPGSRQQPVDPARVRIEQEQRKARNRERQQKLVADTEKLFRLACELKKYVAQTDENVLSVKVIEKAKEIEDLADSIQDKMKTTY